MLGLSTICILTDIHPGVWDDFGRFRASKGFCANSHPRTTHLNSTSQGHHYKLAPLCENYPLNQDSTRPSGTEKVPQRTFATKILPNFRVNFLVQFASKPLLYWVVPSNCSENSLVLFVRFFGFGVLFPPLSMCWVYAVFCRDEAISVISEDNATSIVCSAFTASTGSRSATASSDVGNLDACSMLFSVCMVVSVSCVNPHFCAGFYIFQSVQIREKRLSCSLLQQIVGISHSVAGLGQAGGRGPRQRKGRTRTSAQRRASILRQVRPPPSFACCHVIQEWPRQTKPKKGQLMNFSQGAFRNKSSICESCLFS